MSSKIRKTKYEIPRVGSNCNRVIELNQKMLILKRFISKNDFFYLRMATELFIDILL